MLRLPPPMKLTFRHRRHRLNMTLAVAEALRPNKPNIPETKQNLQNSAGRCLGMFIFAIVILKIICIFF